MRAAVEREARSSLNLVPSINLVPVVAIFDTISISASVCPALL